VLIPRKKKFFTHQMGVTKRNDVDAHRCPERTGKSKAIYWGEKRKGQAEIKGPATIFAARKR